MNERQHEQRAARFRALGDPTRLRIWEFLRGQCCPVAVDEGDGTVRPACGPTVGEVCCQVTGAEKITSTVSHHLKELRLAGLITIERRGKHMICGVNHEAAASLAAYLSEPGPSAPDPKGANGDECC